MTLREYIIYWQETYDKSQSRPTTYAAHNYVFKNHILPSLGDIPLSELTSEIVGEFLEERRRFGNHRPGSSGLGGETMRHIHRLLQQCLDQAMRDGLIGDNPARAFHYSKPKKVNADVLTPLEMEDYLDAAERLGHLPMFMLALTVGLRQGELIALKWNDLKVKDNDHLFEGRYSPKWPDGKKHARNVYAHTREECEEKLKVLIVEMKAEIAELKRQKGDRH